jgi:hypothetical protein
MRRTTRLRRFSRWTSRKMVGTITRKMVARVSPAGPINASVRDQPDGAEETYIGWSGL